MIWLIWRQHRTQAAVTYALLVLLAAILAITGPHLIHLYDTAGGTGLLGQLQGSKADEALYEVGGLALIALPALIGAFWGAPLVARELETGTHRLIWNQGVTRTRWLVAKLGLTGLAAMAAAGLLSLAVTWWSSPIDAAVGARTNSAKPLGVYFPRLSPVIFNARGVAPIGYVAFAFVVGVTTGVLMRRIVAAMAVTLAVSAVAEVVVSMVVRSGLMAPSHLVTAVTPSNLLNQDTVSVNAPGAWLTSTQIVNAGGHVVPNMSLMSWLRCTPGPGQWNQACLAKLSGYRALVTYQPAAHFWPLQWTETAIFLATAAVVGGFCAWWIRYRLS